MVKELRGGGRVGVEGSLIFGPEAVLEEGDLYGCGGMKVWFRLVARGGWEGSGDGGEEASESGALLKEGCCFVWPFLAK